MTPEKKFPVVEIFGPTIQGEGMDQGRSCHFIRLGGCDYKCDWCDSPHAVLPHLVRNAERLTVREIIDWVKLLAPGPNLVVLSGGNPVLHDLTELIRDLHWNGFVVSLETQGTKWKSWLTLCDRIAVSPKPPSAGQKFDMNELKEFMANLRPLFSGGGWHHAFLKVVVFDSVDYDFARMIHKEFHGVPLYLSAGNDAGQTVANPDRIDERSEARIVSDLIDKGRWLANRVMIDRDMRNVQVQMQNHVLYWGNGRGH